MKRQIPRRIPGIFPFVRHGDQPGQHVIVIKLFRNQHAGKRLPHHVLRIVGQLLGNARSVKIIRFLLPRREHAVVTFRKIIRGGHALRTVHVSRRSGSSRATSVRTQFAERLQIRQAQFNGLRLAWRERHRIVRRHLGAAERGIYRRLISTNQIFVKRIFHIRRSVFRVEEFFEIRLIFGKQQVRFSFAQQPALAILPMLHFRTHPAGNAVGLANHRPPRIPSPRPGVAEPQRRQQMQRRGLRPAIHGGNLDQDVFDIRFGIFRKHIEIAMLGENTGIHEFKFRILPRTPIIFVN